ncbi:MAG: TonB-dependent receptor, partial [Bryobacteraceae bacterium]
TDNFDAEQGMAGGAAITVATKSGTNELHGSAFLYHTNNHLKAKNFFTVGELPKNILNMFGFTLGGPIKKNKLFFFGGWEAMRQRLNSDGTYTVATADQRNGDFSAYSTLIYDPATGASTGAGRTPFAGNLIPASRQSSIAQKMQSLVPLPNLSGTTSNYYSAGTLVFDRDNFDVKGNWNRTDRHSIFMKYSAMNANPECAFALGAAGGGAAYSGSAPGKAHTLTQISTIGHTWTLSPTFIIDGTIGYTRMTQAATNPDYGTNYGLEVLGIPGTNGPDPRQSGMPGFTFTTYTSLGNTDNPRPNFYADQSYTTSHNASFTKGRHEIRFGFDLVRHQLNHYQPELNNPRGTFAFSGAQTALKGGASPNQYNSWAGFLLGLPTSMGKSLQYLQMTGREWQFGWYIRDRIQLGSNLTLSLGVRYEYYPLMTRANRGLERWDPDTNQVIIGGRGGNPDNVGITVSKKLFAPRVGIAYRLGQSTVIRTGYGITYDPLPFSRPLRGPYPATISSSWSGDNSYQPFRSLELGIPLFTGPDISSGFVTLPTTVENRTPWGGHLSRGYIQSWNFIVERKLPADFVATVGYVGTQTVHQLSDLDINAAPVGGGNTGRPLYSKWGRTVATTMWGGWLSGNYHSLQTSINRRISGGLLVKGAYTFSKAISCTDEDGWASVSWNEASVRSRNRALSGFDRTHILQLAWVYESPFGPNKKWAGSGFVSRVMRDWQINGTFSSYTGSPFTVSTSSASLNAPGNSQTADQAKAEVEKLGGIGKTTPFFDPLAFRSVTAVRYGNSGRNILRGPGVVNMDLGVFRTFDLGERFAVQFRAESFNFTNTPHFSNPSATASNMTLKSDGTINSLGGFMCITSATSDERVFRFALRFSF